MFSRHCELTNRPYGCGKTFVLLIGLLLFGRVGLAALPATEPDTCGVPQVLDAYFDDSSPARLLLPRAEADLCGSVSVAPPLATNKCGTLITGTTPTTSFTTTGVDTLTWTFADTSGNQVVAYQPVSVRTDWGLPLPDGTTAEEWYEAQRVLGDGMAGAEGGAGFSLAMNDRIALVGTPHAQVSGVGAGLVHVFERDTLGAEWQPTTVLSPPDPKAGNYFGFSVAIDGDRIAIAAPYLDGNDPAPRPTRCTPTNAGRMLAGGVPIRSYLRPLPTGAR